MPKKNNVQPDDKFPINIGKSVQRLQELAAGLEGEYPINEIEYPIAIMAEMSGITDTLCATLQETKGIVGYFNGK